MKLFCVLTPGRAGSTALMNVLGDGPDVSIPHKHILCPDSELLNPRNFARTAAKFAALTGHLAADAEDLLDAFLRCSEGYQYAGFKCMPQRDGNAMELVRKKNMKAIVLWRRDVASEVASFMVAGAHGTWVRNGEEQTHRITFDQTWKAAARGYLKYILSTQALLQQTPGAIQVCYEDLCEAVQSEPLNAFFERPITFAAPRPPTSGARYVENWQAFCDFLSQQAGAYLGCNPETGLSQD